MKSVQSQQLRYPRYGGAFIDITGHISHLFILLLLITLNMSTATALRHLKIQRKNVFSENVSIMTTSGKIKPQFSSYFQGVEKMNFALEWLRNSIHLCIERKLAYSSYWQKQLLTNENNCS